MIVKKPYAFLIKNFRLINGLLFVMLSYLSIKLFSIYSFFNDYATEHYYINTGILDSTYINYFMFIVASLTIIIGFVIFYLLALKKKENKTYLYMVVYNIVMIVYFLYIFKILQGLNVQSIAVETVRVYRDISLIALIPEIALTLISLTRTFGFNLRQFDFKKDLEEINIEATDNEEVELSLGDDTYKIKRFLRKMLRLTKYFILENRLFVICSSSVIVIIICLSIFLRINVYNANYDENTQIVANSVWYNVKSSYITTMDMKNQKIRNGKTYLLIKLNINNRLNTTYVLSRETFRLSLDDELLFPIFTLNEEFMDLGEVFTPREITKGENKDLIVVYEIDNKKLKSNYVFKIKNYDNKSLGDIQSPYKDITLKPNNLNEIKEEGTYKLSANLDLKNTILSESKLTISEYNISDKFDEKYNLCSSDSCKDITYIVRPNNVGKGDLTVLKLKTKLSLDNNLYMKKYVNTATSLLENYGYLEYTYLDEKKIAYLKSIPVKYNNDTISYLQVSREIKYADKIDLIVLIRGIKFTINLK